MNIINTKIAEYIHLRKLFSKKRNKPIFADEVSRGPKRKGYFCNFQ